MTPPAARAPGGHPEIHAATPLSSDSASSSRPTPTSSHTTASSTPFTPQRGRPTARYPDSLGRVPLHRRGTSKTYERLEDLLREAGYKETRVFTPEAERSARSAAEKQENGAGNSVRGGVGAVVDYITGLVSRGSSLSRGTAPLEDNSARPELRAWSPPPSPLARTAHVKGNQLTCPSSIPSLSHNGSSESLHLRTYVDLSTEVSRRTHTCQVVQRHQSSRGLPPQAHSRLRAHHHHHNNHHHLNNYSSKSSTKPNPPSARAYLRHMVSAPNFKPLGREHRNDARRTVILNDEDSIVESDHDALSRVPVEDNQHEVYPPLPRNWIESVAKALLSGASGPGVVPSDVASTKTAKTVSTRKSSALSDKSNREQRGRAVVRATGGTKPPLLCVQVQDLKAKTSEGQVSCTRVMCRSAPTSRAGSRVRSGTHDDRTNTRNGERRGGDDAQPRNRQRGKERDADVVPSLARMKVENDEWMAPRHRYLSGWGMDASAQAHPDGASDDVSDDGDDEDDEGELGLDRLLVPARRQHSIQSLRRHLQRPRSQLLGGRSTPHTSSSRSGRASPFGGAGAGRPDWGDASWGTSRGREWLASEGEEGEEGYGHVFSGSEAAGTGRSNNQRRRGIPGPWAQWTSSS